MTIEELYKWAVENECENKEFIVASDWHTFGIDSIRQLEIEDNRVLLGEWG